MAEILPQGLETGSAAQRTEGQVMVGTMKVWNVDKGFGFATMEDGGSDLFVHQSEIKVEGDRYRAILPNTSISCVYYLRDSKETAREVTLKGGNNLPGFSSKLEAAQKLSITQTMANRPGMLTGTIKFMNRDKGFGFIVPDAGGEDMFVHVGDIEGQQILNQGEQVSYSTAVKKGTRPQAVQVSPLRPRFTNYPPQPNYQQGYERGYGGYPPQQGFDQYGYPQQQETYGGQFADFPAPAATGSSCNGKVKWFNEMKGFGFILPESGGPEVYFKGTDVQGSGAPLAEGEFITYETKAAPDGKVWAGTVYRARGGDKRTPPANGDSSTTKRAPPQYSAAPSPSGQGQFAYGAQPSAQYSSSPTQGYPTSPVSQYSQQPGRQQYQSQYQQPSSPYSQQQYQGQNQPPHNGGASRQPPYF